MHIAINMDYGKKLLNKKYKITKEGKEMRETRKNRGISERRKRKAKMKNRIITIIQIVLVILFVYSGVKIFQWYKDNSKSKKLLETAKEAVTIDVDNNIFKVDFKKLKETNSDTVAWLHVNGVDLDYPVVQTDNNDYYLNHSYDKSENGAGWIFADYRNKVDGSDRNLVIYGHNRRDGSMFEPLKQTLEDNWYNNNEDKIITLETENQTFKYQIFSTYKIENEDYYITTDFNGNEFEDFVKEIKSRSYINYGLEVTKDDNILTLSTCANDTKYRIVVHAKLIK